VHISNHHRRATDTAHPQSSKVQPLRRAPTWRACALLAAGLALSLGCNPGDVTDSRTEAPSLATSSTVTRVTLAPTDTLRLGPPGAKSVMVGRAWDADGREVAGVTLKFWSGSSNFSLKQQLCASPCTDTVLTTATGTGKVILSEYGGAAIRDTAWVTVTSTVSGPSDTTANPPPADTTSPPPDTSTSASATARGCSSSGYVRVVNVSSASQLASALANAQPGDQIRVAGGTYLGATSLKRSGTDAQRITLCGMPGTWPVLKGGRLTVTGSYITITGLVFEGPNGSQNNVFLSGGHDLTFSGNEIRKSDWHAGISVELTHHTTIAYNYIHDNGIDRSIDHGIYFRQTTGAGNRIVGNLLLRNAARGLSMHDNGGGAISNVLVAHNTAAGNGSTGILVNVNGGSNNVIANNVVTGNGDATGQRQIRVLSGASNLVTHNLTWSATSSRAGIENTTSSTLVGNVIGNPLFIAPYTNVRLQAGSPAVGLADPARVVSPDYDGKPRDGSPDAGAYER
jgi:hypothetical protein